MRYRFFTIRAIDPAAETERLNAFLASRKEYLAQRRKGAEKMKRRLRKMKLKWRSCGCLAVIESPPCLPCER